jgi:hypothetical protein
MKDKTRLTPPHRPTLQAYLEFFVAPALLDELVKRIEKDPRITYYAVNRQGDLRTNTHSEGPNAVTWGVFPGKEIIQVTCGIFERSRNFAID